MFDPVAHAKEEVAPLLELLCRATADEGEDEQHAFFAGILRTIEAASHSDHLADPFLNLSMSAFLGFAYSAQSSVVLDLVLEKAQRLSEALSLDDNEVQ